MDKKSFGIANLMIKFLRNQTTLEEDTELQRWSDEYDPKNTVLESFKDNEIIEKELKFISTIDADLGWKTLQEKRQFGFKLRKKMRYAASIALLLCSGLLAYLFLYTFKHDAGIVADKTNQYKNDVLPGKSRAALHLADGAIFLLGNEKSKTYEWPYALIQDHEGEVVYQRVHPDTAPFERSNSLRVPKSGIYRIILEDGTKVWVNSLSSIEFPNQFDEHERKVKVSGEAFFEVARDPNRPFRVECAGVIITALGTAFNVNTYKSKLIATLTEGSIKINAADAEKVLVPGETANVDQREIVVKKTGTEKAIAWKNGYFYFDGENMTQIAQELARWYDLKINIADSIKHKKTTYRGSIKRSATLAQVCEMLTLISDLDFEIDGRNLLVKEQK